MLRPGHAVAVCVLALLMVGIVMVNSAGMTIGSRETFTIESILLSRTSIYAGLAVLAMIACAFIPVRRLIPTPPGGCDTRALEEPALSPSWCRAVLREYIKLWPLWACVLVMLAMLASVYVPGIRSPKNGSHRWINLHVPGFESVQPSEVAKWGMVLLVAWFASRAASKMRSFWIGMVPGLAMIGLVCAIVVVEDLGTGALMAAAACIVLIAAGVRFWHLLILCPLPVAGAVLAIVTNPYRMHRIESFMNPYLDPQGKGFHMIQSMLTVSSGRIFGTGLGGSVQKFGYLPEDTTDFIFAVVCDELGIFGAAIVLFLLGGLVWSVWQVVRREDVRALKLMGLGIMATVGVQAVINLAVVTGLGPTKGIALPLISSGGTGWILTAAALGLVIAMDRAQEQAVRRRSTRAGEPDVQPELYAMPALGAVALTAAAATATLAEHRPERAEEALTTKAEEDAVPEEIVAEACDEPVNEPAFTESEPQAAEPEPIVEAALEPAPPESVAAIGLPTRLVETPVQEAPPEPAPATMDEVATATDSTDDVAEMFAGVIVSDTPALTMSERVQQEVGAEHREVPAVTPPFVEAKPSLQLIPGEPGKTGLLFDPNAEPIAAAEPARRDASKPEIVVTDAGRNHLTRSTDEAAQP